MKAADGLVLAADSRVTEGYTLRGPKTSDNSVKFIQLKDNLGILTYGLSVIGYNGITALKEGIVNDSNIKSVLEKCASVFKEVDSDWSKENPQIKRHNNDVGFMLAGYEKEEERFMIFNLQSPDYLPKGIEGGCLLAGQWHVAKYLVNKLYKSSMPVEALKDIAAFLLSATMSVEKTVGGAILLATITKSGFRWASSEEVNSIMERNSVFSRRLQKKLSSALTGALNGWKREVTQNV